MIKQAMVLATAVLVGNWVAQDGGIVNVYSCGEKTLCVKVMRTIHGAIKDLRNPDEKLRSRNLCGLVIGQGFVLSDENHAAGGHIYDPESGNTYSGKMTLDGDVLKLRGYVGAPIFGRTEIWKRAGDGIEVCGGGAK